jgi:nitrate/nitrite transport system substrate-binding protein
VQRRSFLKSLGAAAITAPTLGGALAACGGGDGDGTATGTIGTGASAAGGDRSVKVGFIPLTDASSVIMAYENGDYADRDLDVSVLKQASWPATRDALLNGDIDMAHALFSMPMSLAAGIGGAGERDLRIAMILSNNGQAITLGSEFADAGYADLDAAGELLRSRGAPALAMTYPGGTHDLWLRYWIAAAGVDASQLSIQPIPPPQMVANMQAGTVQGYCVGEPWNAVAVSQGIGFTHLATQDLWLDHPEKALVCHRRMVEERPEVVRDMIRSVLASSAWLDVPENRSSAADVVGREQYVNAPPDDIRGRLTGVYQLGADLGERDFAGEQMQFHRDGGTNLPRRSYVHWTLAQYQRLGYVPEVPDPAALADELVLTDLYAEAAEAEGVAIPDDDMSPFEIRLDGTTFDPADFAAEAGRA